MKHYSAIVAFAFMLVSCGPQNNSDCVIYDDFYVGIQQVSQDKWDDALNDEFKPRWDDWDCSYEIHFIINKGNPGCGLFAGFRSIVKANGDPASDNQTLSCEWDGEDFKLFDSKGALRFDVHRLGEDKYSIKWPVSPGPIFDRFSGPMGWANEMTLEKTKIALD